MRTKIVALLILISCCIGSVFAENSDEWYQGKPVRTITFEGLANVSRTELDGLFASYIGKNFSDELYWDILQKLYALEYFETINPVALPGDPDNKTVILQFAVTEKPVIRSIKFTGNNKIRAGELLDKVALKEGDVYNEMKSRVDERAVRDYYLDKGYASVKVSSEAVANDDKSITLKFNITEGKQTVVSSIAFEGNLVMSSKTLKKVLSLKEAKFLSSGTFKESALEDDKNAIERYYRERGYIDAVVENVVRETDPESSDEKNLLKLTFVIKEGDQYTYGGTTIEGNQIFTTEELAVKIKLKEGDVMNQSRFDVGFQAIADIYYENGYTSSYINKRENRDTGRKEVSYIITIVENTRSHVENIVIRGNTKTKDNVIIREFSLEPGDIFSKTKLLDSMRNLYNLRYFSSITPDLEQGSEQNLVDVIINLEEQTTASVQFGVTYSGSADAEAFPISAIIKWEETNFRGEGKTLSADLMASFDTQTISVGYSENWFLGSPLTVSFSLSAAHETLSAYQDAQFPLFNDYYYDDNGIVPDPYTSLDEYDSTSNLDTSYKMKYTHWEYSFATATGYRWNPQFATVTLRGGVNFSVARNVYDASVYRPADATIRNAYGAWGWNNYVWTRLSLDRRDINYDPSTGWFASEQVNYYGILPMLAPEYYIRSVTKAEGYLTLLNIPVSEVWNFKLVLAGFTSLSFQLPVANSQISDSNQLYIDGMFNGRGWTSIYSSLKGNMMMSHSAELRLPMVPGIIAADMFFDAAAVKDGIQSMSSLSLNDYYFSFGPGLRISMPQFPLRFLLTNRFRIQDGKFEWANGKGPDWTFVLSFTIANL